MASSCISVKAFCLALSAALPSAISCRCSANRASLLRIASFRAARSSASARRSSANPTSRASFSFACALLDHLFNVEVQNKSQEYFQIR